MASAPPGGNGGSVVFNGFSLWFNEPKNLKALMNPQAEAKRVAEETRTLQLIGQGECAKESADQDECRAVQWDKDLRSCQYLCSVKEGLCNPELQTEEKRNSVTTDKKFCYTKTNPNDAYMCYAKPCSNANYGNAGLSGSEKVPDWMETSDECDGFRSLVSDGSVRLAVAKGLYKKGMAYTCPAGYKHATIKTFSTAMQLAKEKEESQLEKLEEGAAEEDCHKQNTIYSGGKLISSRVDVESVQACQKLCQSEVGCEYFSYIDASSRFDDKKTCYLKEAPVRETKMRSVTSGPRKCGVSKSMDKGANYFSQCGWQGSRWQARMRQYFLFQDYGYGNHDQQMKNFAAINVSSPNGEISRYEIFRTDYNMFAGIVCVKLPDFYWQDAVEVSLSNSNRVKTTEVSSDFLHVMTHPSFSHSNFKPIKPPIRYCISGSESRPDCHRQVGFDEKGGDGPFFGETSSYALAAPALEPMDEMTVAVNLEYLETTFVGLVKCEKKENQFHTMRDDNAVIFHPYDFLESNSAEAKEANNLINGEDDMVVNDEKVAAWISKISETENDVMIGNMRIADMKTNRSVFVVVRHGVVHFLYYGVHAYSKPLSDLSAQYCLVTGSYLGDSFAARLEFGKGGAVSTPAHVLGYVHAPQALTDEVLSIEFKENVLKRFQGMKNGEENVKIVPRQIPIGGDFVTSPKNKKLFAGHNFALYKGRLRTDAAVKILKEETLSLVETYQICGKDPQCGGFTYSVPRNFHEKDAKSLTVQFVLRRAHGDLPLESLVVNSESDWHVYVKKRGRILEQLATKKIVKDFLPRESIVMSSKGLEIAFSKKMSTVEAPRCVQETFDQGNVVDYGFKANEMLNLLGSSSISGGDSFNFFKSLLLAQTTKEPSEVNRTMWCCALSVVADGEEEQLRQLKRMPIVLALDRKNDLKTVLVKASQCFFDDASDETLLARASPRYLCVGGLPPSCSSAYRKLGSRFLSDAITIKYSGNDGVKMSSKLGKKTDATAAFEELIQSRSSLLEYAIEQKVKYENSFLNAKNTVSQLKSIKVRMVEGLKKEWMFRNRIFATEPANAMYNVETGEILVSSMDTPLSALCYQLSRALLLKNDMKENLAVVREYAQLINFVLKESLDTLRELHYPVKDLHINWSEETVFEWPDEEVEEDEIIEKAPEVIEQEEKTPLTGEEGIAENDDINDDSDEYYNELQKVEEARAIYMEAKSAWENAKEKEEWRVAMDEALLELPKAMQVAMQRAFEEEVTNKESDPSQEHEARVEAAAKKKAEEEAMAEKKAEEEAMAKKKAEEEA
eukprot:g697.t1